MCLCCISMWTRALMRWKARTPIYNDGADACGRGNERVRHSAHVGRKLTRSDKYVSLTLSLYLCRYANDAHADGTMRGWHHLCPCHLRRKMRFKSFGHDFTISLFCSPAPSPTQRAPLYMSPVPSTKTLSV